MTARNAAVGKVTFNKTTKKAAQIAMKRLIENQARSVLSVAHSLQIRLMLEYDTSINLYINLKITIMAKKSAMAIVLIFISWMFVDLMPHGILLGNVYKSTPEIWRPAYQMNIPLIYIVTFFLILCIVLIYNLLINPKSLRSGFRYGVLLGLIMGTASGFGPYLHMPIPLVLAIGWLFGGWIKAIVAGLIVGSIIKPSAM